MALNEAAFLLKSVKKEKTLLCCAFVYSCYKKEINQQRCHPRITYAWGKGREESVWNMPGREEGCGCTGRI